MQVGLIGLRVSRRSFPVRGSCKGVFAGGARSEGVRFGRRVSRIGVVVMDGVLGRLRVVWAFGGGLGGVVDVERERGLVVVVHALRGLLRARNLTRAAE